MSRRNLIFIRKQAVEKEVFNECCQAAFGVPG